MRRRTKLTTAILATLSLSMSVSSFAANDRMILTGKGHLIGAPIPAEAIIDTDSSKMSISDEILSMQDQLSTFRRDLHKIPELGFDTPRTHAYLTNALKSMGLEPQNVGDSMGIMVDIKGEDESYTIGIRADFDGLPILQTNDVEYASEIEGQMHACGHDAHSAIVLGIAQLYANKVIKPKTNIRLIFQPAEEIGTGARAMIDAGVLEGVDSIIGLHVDPTREYGRVGLTPLSWSAFATGFTIEVEGKAAHAGMAVEEGKDAILVGSYITNQLQSIISRDVAAADAGVVTVATFSAGTALNQLSDKAVLSGTTRAATLEDHELIKKRMAEIVEGASISMDTPIDLNFIVEAPGTVNNENIYNMAVEAANRVLGEENVDIYMRPGMGGEDFAEYSQLIPAYFYNLGSANKEKGITAGLHTADFDIDERALPAGVAMQLEIIDAISEYHKSGGEL
ncbi:M20 family metallopeptidase [Vibrio sp. FNV 38]|nr:M20 family metallopeptidase [Vibrio sp. FNV 38]